MSSDVRKIIYGTLILFLGTLVVWIGFLFVVGCSGTLGCVTGVPTPVRTGVATLLPATPLAPVYPASGEAATCQVRALDLLEAWVNAGSPEEQPFTVSDLEGATCTAAFQDVEATLAATNLWYTGSAACVTCHNLAFASDPAGLDLSTYQGIIAGSHRTAEDDAGDDILGGGNWSDSRLYEVLVMEATEPQGRPPGLDLTTVVVFAGTPEVALSPTASPAATATPLPSATPSPTP
jgi:hypothetical protein